MDYEEVALFLDKDIKVSTDFDGNGGRRTYTGKIVKLTETTMLLLDKFKKHQLMTIDSIKWISEVDEQTDGGLQS